jgi:putative Mg2+ transporter-C (MgtC) family protein
MLLERFLSEFSFDLSVFLFDIIIPCVLAMIFGGLIGFQRERHERPAGLRTHALVCLGATVFTLVSYLGFSSSAGLDSTRIAAGVVTGIGFIGAGVIFRQGILVKGVTTAASIWIVAAIGLALGTKLYYLSIISTILGFLILSFLKSFEYRIIRSPNYLIKITASKDFDDIGKIRDMIKDFSLDIKSKKYEFEPDSNTKMYSYNIHSKIPDLSQKIIDRISKIDGVLKITVD